MVSSTIPLTLGIIGNIMSVLSFCSTIPTFWRIIKRKSVEDFSDHPYVVSLLNCLLWSYYGLLDLKHGGLMLLTVNAIGCAFQYVYLAIYFAFSTPHKRMITGMFFGVVHVIFVGMVLVVEFLLEQASTRLLVMGVSSAMAAIAMFGSPLSIMGLVIRRKSVEYMPFLLSLFLTLRSGTWCSYGYVIQDIFIEITNTIGVSLGIAQLVLYLIYCNKSFHKHKSNLSNGENIVELRLTESAQAKSNEIDIKVIKSSDNIVYSECKEGK